MRYTGTTLMVQVAADLISRLHSRTAPVGVERQWVVGDRGQTIRSNGCNGRRTGCIHAEARQARGVVECGQDPLREVTAVVPVARC